MTDIWQDMRATLAADDNLGVDATFTAKEGGVPVAVRIVPSRPEAAYGGLPSAPRGVAIATTVMLPASAITGRPVEGDLIAFGDASYRIAGAPRQDSRGASFECDLKRVP